MISTQILMSVQKKTVIDANKSKYFVYNNIFRLLVQLVHVRLMGKGCILSRNHIQKWFQRLLVVYSN